MKRTSPLHNVTELPFRSIVLAIYIPSFLMAIGVGAGLPFLPLFAQELGAEVGLVGIIVGLGEFGILFFDLPGGVLITRIGSKKAMLFGGLASALLALLTGLSTNLLWLGVVIFLRGVTESAWQVARLTFLRHAIPIHIRGRSLSLIGGITRIGRFIGPIAGGYIAASLGYRYVFFIQAGLMLAGFAVFVLVAGRIGDVRTLVEKSAVRNLGAVLVKKRKVLATAGTGMVVLSLLRTARSIIIPLWGMSIGLSVTEIGLVFGIGSAIDMVMFIPAGQLMDRLGSKWAALIGTCGVAAGFVLIPLTSGFSTFLLVSMLMGVTNGMGSGINMTLGSDLAPDESPEHFISLWRFISDAGRTAGPLLIGGVAQAVSLAVSCLVTGGFGILGVIFMAFMLPETLRRKKRSRA